MLLKSVLTGTYIRFGSGNPKGKEFTRHNIAVIKISKHTLDYKPYAHDSDFSFFWPHDHNSLDDNPVTMEDKKDV